MNTQDRDWRERQALDLFGLSVLKQEKYRQFNRLLGDTHGLMCLDIGADNGVISLLFRRRGGNWTSADLDEKAVGAIGALLGENVYQLDGGVTPFSDNSFDLVAVVDFLEHVETDHEFVRDLVRILRPGGVVIINVPHLKPRSFVNRIRLFLGLTDEKHGHLRPGYSEEGLRRILGDQFFVESAHTYSKSFSELVDTGLNALYEWVQCRKKKDVGSKKGAIVEVGRVNENRAEFMVLRILYPVIWMCCRLDALLPIQRGYKLILKARRTDAH